MNQRTLIRTYLTTCLLAVLCASWCAADPPEHCPPARASHVPLIARCAIPSDTGHYVGYYVGGGCGRPHKADPRGPEDGTWGWDYQGWLFPRRVIFGWWHGRRYQGGTGAYRTDGPLLYHHEEKPHSAPSTEP